MPEVTETPEAIAAELVARMLKRVEEANKRLDESLITVRIHALRQDLTVIRGGLRILQRLHGENT